MTSVAPDVDLCDEHALPVEDSPLRPVRSGGDPRAGLREIDPELFVRFAEDALGAEKACKCGAAVPDWSARTQGARLALEMGWGRAPVAPEDSRVDLETDPARYSAAERAGLAAAVKALADGQGVDLDEVRRAARDAVTA